MTVFVLAGGMGTRLAGLFPDRPKALVPVLGRPFVERQLEWLAGHGFDDVVLCLGHGAGAVLDHLGDGSRFGVRLRTVVEDAPRGTAGAIATALAETGHGPATFLAVNGDTWADFDPTSLLSLHRDLEAWATLAVYPVADSAGRGTVAFDADGRLTGFREKEGSGPGWASGGLYALEPRALKGLGDGPASLERDLFPRLIAAGRTVAAWRGGGHFWDMGTPDGLARAEAALASRETR